MTAHLQQTIRLNFMGDVMLGELLENFRCGVKSNILRGVNPFEFCQPEFRSADLNVANLECVLSDHSNQASPFDQILRAPKEFVRFLKSNGIHVVNTANNHALDHGWKSLNHSLSILAEHQIVTIGYGPNQVFQSEPVVLWRSGIRLGLLGYNIANFSETDKERRVADIVSILETTRNGVDVMAVSLHWGEEYTDVPPPECVQIARRLFDAGCDILHGHHSHRLQGVVDFNGKLFAPSLGNFIFDDSRGENLLTGILRVEVGKDGIRSFQLLPYLINRHFQPAPWPPGAKRIVSLNRRLADLVNSRAGTDASQWRVQVSRAVRRGHAKNRRRMRMLMLLRWYNYLGHYRALFKMAKRGERRFSIAEEAATL